MTHQKEDLKNKNEIKVNVDLKFLFFQSVSSSLLLLLSIPTFFYIEFVKSVEKIGFATRGRHLVNWKVIRNFSKVLRKTLTVAAPGADTSEETPGAPPTTPGDPAIGAPPTPPPPKSGLSTVMASSESGDVAGGGLEAIGPVPDGGAGNGDWEASESDEMTVIESSPTIVCR